MFGFIKNVFFVAMAFSSFNPLSVNSLECLSMNNQTRRIRAKVIDINNKEPTFDPFSVSVNKCSVSCNNINDPYAKFCVPSSIENINVKVFNLSTENVNVKVFNLMSKIYQARHIK